MKFPTCNPQPPQQYFHDDPPEIWVTWYNNALITCHLAKATAAAAGAAWYFSFLLSIEQFNEQGMLGGYLGTELPRGIQIIQRSYGNNGNQA